MSTPDILSSIQGLADVNSPSFGAPVNGGGGSPSPSLQVPPSNMPPAMANATINENGSPSQPNQPQPNQPAPPDPNAPHAGILNIMQSLFEGMSAFAKSAATGGREGGVEEIAALNAQKQNMALKQQENQRAQQESAARLKNLQAITNATIAQTEINKMNAPLEHQKLVIQNQDMLYNLFVNTLHINPLFAVPIVQGQSTDDHMAALNSKTNGDLVNNTVIPVHDDAVGGSGNTYGFSFDQLRKVNLPIDQAAPVLMNLQNQIDYARQALPNGDKNPAIQMAQGKLDALKKGGTVNGYDFFVFDNLVQSQILQKVAQQRQLTDFQQKAAAAKKAAQDADPLFKLENDPSTMAGEKSSAAIPMLQGKLADPATSPNDKIRATRLLAVAQSAHARFMQDTVAKENATQAAKQGDPSAAGAMLARGDLTLQDLKTRGMTPKFIEQSVTAAQKLNPAYKPSDEMIAEQQAKSSTNVTFFGSANSLIQKGGTLDQLATAGGNLPNAQLPVFNKLADFASASAGRAQLPAYEATLLGVADDYAKVMGGGQGSDSARMQVYNSIAAQLNKGQRDGVITAMRRAVGSQVESRIGTNQFMKRIYGYGLANVPGSNASAGAFDPSKLPDAQ